MSLEVKKIKCVCKAARQNSKQSIGNSHVHALPSKYRSAKQHIGKLYLHQRSIPGLGQLLNVPYNAHSLIQHMYIEGLHVKCWARHLILIMDTDLEFKLFMPIDPLVFFKSSYQ